VLRILDWNKCAMPCAATSAAQKAANENLGSRYEVFCAESTLEFPQPKTSINSSKLFYEAAVKKLLKPNSYNLAITSAYFFATALRFIF
jgi:hypothetical protein